MSERRVVEIRERVLSKNDQIAAGVRAALEAKGVTALNFTSSPGSGKTTLLVRTISDLKGRAEISVLEGDQETDHDARRIAATGAPVLQINTISSCHLDAAMVEGGLRGLWLSPGGFLFIENVGNLVCPASYDLGEAMKVVMLSVTEGADKPAKYPKMFRVADAMVITKTDLLPHVEFDVDECVRFARAVNPKLAVFQVSAKTGEGLDEWYGYLLSLRDRA